MFGKRKKISGGQVRCQPRFLRFCFCPKTHAQASICERVRYHGAKSVIGFSTILCISNELLRAIGAQLQDSIPYWPYDLVMYHAIAIEENSEENLHIWLNLSMRRCFCLKFSNFGTIFSGARFMPKISLKIAWHGPNERVNIALLTLNVALLKFMDCVLDFQIRIYLHTHLKSVDPTIIMDKPLLWSVFVETF